MAILRMENYKKLENIFQSFPADELPDKGGFPAFPQKSSIESS